MLELGNISIDLGAIVQSIIPIAVRVGIIVVLTAIAQKFAERGIKKAVDFGVNKRPKESKGSYEKRVDTLSRVIVTTVNAIIWVIAVLIILSEFGINIGPIIAGAGVLGLALSFGSQKLVQDVINGVFILSENQYARGDVVAMGEVGTNQIAGVVEDVNLRRTVLRDLDGVVHYIPNGEIVRASNMTQGHSQINLNIKVAHATDIDKAIDILNQVGKDLAKDKKWGEFTREDPAVMRVDNIDETGIDIKIVGQTEPMKQWDLTGQLRIRIKKAFDKEGIEIPYPHRVIVNSKES